MIVPDYKWTGKDGWFDSVFEPMSGPYPPTRQSTSSV